MSKLTGPAAVFLALALLVGLAYRPSLAHVPRADQWWYLLQTAHQTELPELLARTYSYNRTVAPGDYGLFRPLLFAMLSAETAAFGHDFAKWQYVGIGLHLAVVGLFLALVRRLGGGWAATALAAFFALNVALVEMVMWSHINPYMLFVALEFGAMLLAFDVLTRPDLTASGRLGRLAGAWLLLLAGAFTYEIGQFFAVVVGAVLAYDAWRRSGREALGRLLAFGAILLVYQAADRLDRLAHPEAHRDVDYPSVFASALSWNTGYQAVRYLLFTLVQPFVPSGLKFSPHTGWGLYTRLGFSEPLEAWPARLRLTPTLALSMAVGVLLVARSALAARKLDGGRRLFLLLPAALFGLHLGVTVLGRLNLRPDSLTHSTYYSYLPLLMLLTGFATLWSAAPAPRLDAALAVGLAVLAGLMGCQVHALTTRIKDQVRPFRVQHHFFQRLLRDHGREPGFGIALERDASARLPQFFHMPFPLILYPRVVNADAPTHVVYFEGSELRAMTADEHRRLRPGQRLAPAVRMVRADPPCTVFAYRGRYYGVFHWDGAFDPDRDDHRYLVEGASVAEVLAQLPARDERVRADEATGRFIPPHLRVERAGPAYRGHALFRAGERFYAIPEAEGSLDPARLVNGRYSRWLTARDLEGLKRDLDGSAQVGRLGGGGPVLRGRAFSPCTPPPDPRSSHS